MSCDAETLAQLLSTLERFVKERLGIQQLVIARDMMREVS